VSRVQGHVGSEGARETRSFHAEGEWWALNQAINYNSCVLQCLWRPRRELLVLNSVLLNMYSEGANLN
jgi:hypothetical protein